MSQNLPKFRLYSDLHLDWYAHAWHKTRPYNPEKPETLDTFFWTPEERPDDKDIILILAGDIWIGTLWIEWSTHSWIATVAPRFKQVLVVLGNHDYWPQGDVSIKNAADKCNKMLVERGLFNVKVLDCDTHQDGDVLFVGATLWTDMFNGSPFAMMHLSSVMRYDGKIAFETGPNGAFTRFTPERWIGTHVKHRDYIRHVARNNKDKKIVVISHHGPLLHLHHPHYIGDSINAYYVSDLSNLILDNENIVNWCFGHIHYPVDENFEQCRILNNAVGYIGEHLDQQGLVNHEVYMVGELSKKGLV